MFRTGKIVHGAGRGRTLGYPTVNLVGDFSDMEDGVYAAWVEVVGKRLAGALHYGINRTFNESQQTCEIFLLDYEGDLYGYELRFELIKKIRPSLKFDSVDALVAQIKKDVADVREALYNAGQ